MAHQKRGAFFSKNNGHKKHAKTHLKRRRSSILAPVSLTVKHIMYETIALNGRVQIYFFGLFPTSSNNMTRKIVFATLLLFSLALSVLAIDDEEREILDLVNRERSRQRLSRLTWDESAARLARSYSMRMAREGFFDHYDPEGNSVIERADRGGLRRWNRIGENLFVCDPIDEFAGLAVKGWLRSQTHRQNMLDRAWTATGIGIARSGDGEIYITQVFLER